MTAAERIPAWCADLVQRGAAPAGSLDTLLAMAGDASLPAVARGYARWAWDALAPTAVLRRLHVADGSSSGGDGSSGAPLPSIAAALALARAGDEILIHPGTYRELVAPAVPRLTLRAADPARPPRITAADVLDADWREEGGGWWSAAVPALPWDDPARTDPRSRCEQLWLDGVLVPHLAAREAGEGPAFCCVAGDAGHHLCLRLGGTAPRDHLIERSTRQQVLMPAVRGLDGLAIIGLELVGGAAHVWGGGNWSTQNQLAVLSVDGGHGWRILDNIVRDGNAQGIQVADGGFAGNLAHLPLVNRLGQPPADDAHHVPGRNGNVVRGNRVLDHGIAGIVGIGCCNGLVIDGNVLRGNNRKRHGNCEEAAIKLHSTRGCVVSRNRIEATRAHGIWLDCECSGDRVSGNVLIDTDGNAIMYEISPGPVLIDGNVVIDSRGQEAGACGFYTHDGNHATVINNVFAGVRQGVRVRALFHRLHRGAWTTTCDHLIANGIFDCNAVCAVSIMPEVPRAERHHSAANLLWNGGAEPVMRYENSGDVGVAWETTAIGRALGRSGGGNLDLPAASWRAAGTMDQDSRELPPAEILGADPDAWPGVLARAWLRLGLPPPEAGHAPVAVQPMDAWLSALRTEAGLTGPPPVPVRLAPDAGLLVAAGRLGAWRGERLGTPEACGIVVAGTAERVMAADAGRLAGHALAAGAPWPAPPAGMRVIAASASRAPSLPGGYRLLCEDAEGRSGFLDVAVLPALAIDPPMAVPGEPWQVRVRLHNRGAILASGPLAVTCDGGAPSITPASVAGGASLDLLVPLPPCAGGAAVVAAAWRPEGAGELRTECKLPLITVREATAFDLLPRYSLDAAPDAVFPEDARWSSYYTGELRAWWQVRRCPAGLEFRVEVHTPHIQANRADMEGIHVGCGLKIAIKGAPGRRLSVYGLARLDADGRTVAGFCKSPDPQRWPATARDDLDAAVERGDGRTVYRLLVPWEQLGLAACPPAGSRLPCAIALFTRSSDARYGLRWFDGILYDAREGDEAAMGWLIVA